MTAVMSEAVLERHARAASCDAATSTSRIFDSLEEVYSRRRRRPDPGGQSLRRSDGSAEASKRARCRLGTSTPGRKSGPILAALRREGRVHDFETEFRLPDGRLVPCAMNLALVTEEETGQTRIVGSLRDITEQKRVESERRQLEQRMLQAQKLESLGVLAGGIAHDFNNLLTGILGSAELAAVELPPDHAARPRIEAVRSSPGAPPICAASCSPTPAAPASRRSRSTCRRLVRDMDELLRVSVSGRVSLKSTWPTSFRRSRETRRSSDKSCSTSSSTPRKP